MTERLNLPEFQADDLEASTTRASEEVIIADVPGINDDYQALLNMQLWTSWGEARDLSKVQKEALINASRFVHGEYRADGNRYSIHPREYPSRSGIIELFDEFRSNPNTDLTEQTPILSPDFWAQRYERVVSRMARAAQVGMTFYVVAEKMRVQPMGQLVAAEFVDFRTVRDGNTFSADILVRNAEGQEGVLNYDRLYLHGLYGSATMHPLEKKARTTDNLLTAAEYDEIDTFWFDKAARGEWSPAPYANRGE